MGSSRKCRFSLSRVAIPTYLRDDDHQIPSGLSMHNQAPFYRSSISRIRCLSGHDG